MAQPVEIRAGGVPTWLVTVASIAVLYPAAMSAWFWFGAMEWGPTNITTNRCIQWGFGHSGGINCFGEGWAEASFMVAGVLLGLFAMGVLVYARAWHLGRWMAEDHRIRARSWPRIIVAIFWAWPAIGILAGVGDIVAVVRLLAPPLFGIGGFGYVHGILFTQNPLGPSSSFETIFIGGMLIAVSLLVSVGIYRGSGYQWSDARWLDSGARSASTYNLPSMAK